MLRATRLLIDGAIDPDYPILATKGFISASFTPEITDGDSIEEKNASGEVCISWKADDTLTRITFNLSLCTPDPEMTAMLAGGQVILACEDDEAAGVVTGDVIGYSSPPVGSTIGNPVALEIWSIANVGGKPATGLPYWHYVFPYVKVRYDGDREFSNGALANEFSGQGLGNGALTEEGLNPLNVDDDFVTYRNALINPFSYVRANSLPDEGWTGSLVVSPDNSLVCEVPFTDVTPGAPGEFVPENAWPSDFEELVAGPDPSDPTEWGSEEYVVLGDSSEAYWDGDEWQVGRSPFVAATGATAGIPGTWTPSGSSPPASVAALIAEDPEEVIATPLTAWTTGQYIQTQTAGVPGRAHWNSTAWVAGVA
jgi:hypothetical protein